MLTFSNHNIDAPQAAEAVRALAHATIRFDHDDEPPGPDNSRPEHPKDTYWTLGNVLAIVRSLSQVIQQIDAAHTRNAGLARTDDGSAAEGREHVAAVHQAALDAQLALERVHSSLDDAMSHSARIAWHPPESLAFTAETATIAAEPGATAAEVRDMATDLSDHGTLARRSAQGPGL
ncbi:hypothetical protein [Promicromonospora soli]